MSRTQLESSIRMKPPQQLVNPGKIYIYGSYLLINEKYKGVHIINNTNPAMPEQLGFLQVPGNIDFAVKKQVLYVDNAVDLVAVNLQDLEHITIAKRIKDAFPPLTPPDGRTGMVSSANAPADAVIVSWELKTNN
ncbi:hypothetical protein FVR03_22035 [Pontibacter qinzhouensis]|uniref:YncE family protein n=1 Tax=Pontibacter qinzhouensis TaxID=2603253 RepID=A0A5C8ITZ8_9BACT|nr:hypothetical protein [Pontibacter qinzhouensis]TXK25018.1 hypothetical protein FVR03_22035 [Pontibacter qinzhouensis]